MSIPLNFTIESKIILVWINIDIIIEICNYLSDKNKIMFLSVNKILDSNKNNIFYNDRTRYYNIKNLWYHDQFTDICVLDLCKLHILPKHVKKLQIYYLHYGAHIPNSITHLIFESYFNQYINGIIPKNVTYLSLGSYYKKDIKDAIPITVKKLVISKNYPYKSSIPKTCEVDFY